MTGLFDLTGKVAIITGSSRGIGKAIAEALAAHGAKVVISSRNQDACEEVAAAINGAHPGAAIAVAASISSKVALQNLVDQTKAAFGQVDILVCNAASNPYYGPMAGISDDQFRKILDNNVIANHWLINMVAPEMLAREDGSIIIISSVGGLTGSSRGIGKAIAEALAAHGAKVAISSRNQDACEEVAAAINGAYPGAAIAVAASISSKEALQNLVDQTKAAFGQVDILVCNAASNPYYGPMAGISDDQFRKILDNNVIANHWLINMVAPEMLAPRGRLDHHHLVGRRADRIVDDRGL